MWGTLLERHRTIWERKPVLRAVYGSWYEKIRGVLKSGKTLEIGGGSGNLKEHLPGIIASDIVPLPWLDLVSDALALPVKDESMSNLVLFDVLHHLEDPFQFFDEALRVLRSEGRVVLMEPYVSPLSYPIYRFLHQEALDMRHEPFEIRKPSSNHSTSDANQALPTLIFFRHKRRFETRYPALKVIRRNRIGFFAYPLSGGFDHPSLLPLWALRPLFLIERLLGFLAPILAFRLFVILEKESA